MGFLSETVGQKKRESKSLDTCDHLCSYKREDTRGEEEFRPSYYGPYRLPTYSHTPISYRPS